MKFHKHRQRVTAFKFVIKSIFILIYLNSEVINDYSILDDQFVRLETQIDQNSSSVNVHVTDFLISLAI